MRKAPFFSKPEYWLIVLALIGALAGTLATYGRKPSSETTVAATSGKTATPGASDEESWRIQDEENTVEVFEAAKRGVVLVATIRSGLSSASAAGTSRRGNGSGFFIDSEGHIVTNNHVIEDAVSIEVQTYSGTSFKASVVGSDRLTDLAVLKVQAPKKEIFPLPLADHRQVQVGQKAIVLGSPLATGSSMGLDRSPTVTTGIISAKDRSLPIESLTKPGVNDFTIENLIQTDAAVNPGNSGGPLLNSKGEVVGVVTAIIDSATGIGFAIPSQVVSEVIPQILKSGQVKRAFMGIAFYPLDALAKEMDSADFEQLGIGASRGALVTEVEENGPAYRAGLKGSTGKVTAGGQDYLVGGDMITSINGVEVRGSNLSGEILKYRPGDKVKLDILRGGQKLTVEVVLGSR
jgi:S1-C subfamily serine protease